MMRSETPQSLAAANLLYRDPGLHDYLQGPSTGDIDVINHALDLWAPEAATLLDAGCGTGTFVAGMSGRLRGLGVDLQPQLVDHARRRHPECSFEVGELCTLDLNRTFDVITCLGNVLSYLRELDELNAAATSIARHAHPGTVVVISTLITPPPTGPARTGRVDTPDGPAIVTVQNTWDDDAQLAVMARRWTFPDRRVETDVVRRRVHDLPTLIKVLTVHGFETRAAFDTLATRYENPQGPAAFVIVQKAQAGGRGPGARFDECSGLLAA